MTQPISNFQELFAHMNYLLEHAPESELEDIAALPVRVQGHDGTVDLEVNGIEMMRSGLFLTTTVVGEEEVR